ncbi:unnamed protein product [Lampetra planeri]
MRNKAAPHAPALYAVGKARRSAAVKGSAAATSSATTSSAATSSHRDDDDDDDDDGEESVEYLLVGKATYDLFNTLKEASERAGVFSPRADDVLSVELRSSADSDLRLKWSTVEWRSAARVPLEGCQEYVSDRLGYRPRFDHLIVKRDACTVS